MIVLLLRRFGEVLTVFKFVVLISIFAIRKKISKLCWPGRSCIPPPPAATKPRDGLFSLCGSHAPIISNGLKIERIHPYRDKNKIINAKPHFFQKERVWLGLKIRYPGKGSCGER